MLAGLGIYIEYSDKMDGYSMDLSVAEIGKEYIIKAINTGDEELDSFLFSLGCYAGEPITVVSRKKSGCTVAIKEARYHIDTQLSRSISV